MLHKVLAVLTPFLHRPHPGLLAPHLRVRAARYTATRRPRLLEQETAGGERGRQSLQFWQHRSDVRSSDLCLHMRSEHAARKWSRQLYGSKHWTW